MVPQIFGQRPLAGILVVGAALVPLLSVASCGGTKTQVASAPDEATTSSSSVPPSTDAAASDGIGTRISAQSLRSQQDVPDDVADVLSFSEGGNDPCDGEGPEPYTFLVALPSYEEVSKIERGWDTVLCAGTDAGSLEHLLITSPDEKTLIDEDAPGDPEATATIPIGGGADKQSAGEITVSWSSASISAFPLLSSELGEYTIAARINGEDFERKFEVSHASTGRVYVVGAPQVGTVGPGDIEVQLFGYDPENGVDLDLYTSGSSEDDGVPYRFAHRSNIAVSEQGEARVILDRDGLEPGCWAVLANAPSASDFASDGPDSVPGVMYFDTYKDLFCIPDD